MVLAACGKKPLATAKDLRILCPITNQWRPPFVCDRLDQDDMAPVEVLMSHTFFAIKKEAFANFSIW